MNTYSKFVPNVFLAKCEEKHERGETIVLTTKRGGGNECIVFNLIYERNGFYFYSIVRADGFNVQEWAKKRSEKLNSYASNAEKRSDDAYNSRASKGELEFMRLGEPIKVGHHSEKRHRKLFEKYDNKMRKSVEEGEKAEEYKRRAQYWDSMANTINLSMPESIEFYGHKLEKAIEYHEGLKSGKYPRQHSYSLTYAKKEVNELTNKFNLAKKLWE